MSPTDRRALISDADLVNLAKRYVGIFAKHVGPTDREDLVSAVIEIMLRKLDSYDPRRASLETYLFLWSRSIVQQTLRRAKRVASHELPMTDFSDTVDTQSMSLIARELRGVFMPHRSERLFSDDNISIFIDRFYNGTPFALIAERRGVTRQRVHQIYRKMVQRLQEGVK